MIIRILHIDDDDKVCKQISELLNGESVEGHTLRIKYVNRFEEGIALLSEQNFDLVILDLFRGKPEEGNIDRPGEEVLKAIKASCFVPVIFFTGLVKPVEQLKSDIVKVVRKGDGIDALREAMNEIFSSRLPFLKQQLFDYTREVLRSYFWDFVHPNWKILEKVKDEISLGYLAIRRLAISLSKEKMAGFLKDPKILPNKVHPMEFYIFPPVREEFETGDILMDDQKRFYVILTPSCDFISRDGPCKAENVMLAECFLLKGTREYKKYQQAQTPENKKDLIRLVESRRGDRYFFLPKAPFIENSILDFQQVLMIKTGELNKLSKLARLDDPFAQSMLASFIRYYNRIGFPDIDSDYILRNL